jgi:hypothetical protein
MKVRAFAARNGTIVKFSVRHPRRAMIDITV